MDGHDAAVMAMEDLVASTSSDVLTIEGLRRTGKTTAGAAWVNRMAAYRPGTTIILVDLPVRNYVMALAVGDAAKSDARPTWQPSKRRLDWPNGSVGIVARSEVDMLGSRATHFWFDNFNDWPEDMKCGVFHRARTLLAAAETTPIDRMPRPLILITTGPDRPSTYREIIEAPYTTHTVNGERRR